MNTPRHIVPDPPACRSAEVSRAHTRHDDPVTGLRRSLHWSAVLLLAGVVTAFVPPVADAQQQVFFGNLHSHTSYSDGRDTPEDAYRHARDVAGLDFLAVTEHNHATAPSRIENKPHLYNGSQDSSVISTASRFTVDGRFIALYGQEWSSIGTGNHANVFEVGEVIQRSEVANGDWRTLLTSWLPAHLDSQGNPAIMLLNHPAQSSSPNNREYGIDAGDLNGEAGLRALLDPHAQLINIVNGPSHGGSSPGNPSEGEFLRYLNMGMHLAPTADQDNHRRNWGDAAETRTGVVATALTKPVLLQALRARHVYATQDNNLRLIVRYNGELMGTRFQGSQVPAAGTAIAITVDVADDDEPFAIYTFEVFADVIGGPERALVIGTFEGDGDGVFILDGISYGGGRQYFFVKVTQTDDDGVIVDHAWTAPVWFEPTPGVLSGQQLVTLAVDLVAEEATVTNDGTDSLDLTGWILVSTRGNQRFTFPTLTLAAGQSVVVTSGAGAADNPPIMLRWTTSNMWRNVGDPAQLLDRQGVVQAETQ